MHAGGGGGGLGLVPRVPLTALREDGGIGGDDVPADHQGLDQERERDGALDGFRTRLQASPAPVTCLRPRWRARWATARSTARSRPLGGQGRIEGEDAQVIGFLRAGLAHQDELAGGALEAAVPQSGDGGGLDVLPFAVDPDGHVLIPRPARHRRRCCRSGLPAPAGGGGELRAHQLRFPRLHLPGASRPGPRGYFMASDPAISGKAKKAKGQQIRDWHLNRRRSADLSSLAEPDQPASAEAGSTTTGPSTAPSLHFLAWRVVAGAPSSGKSGSAVLLILAALQHREAVPGMDRLKVPVPVMFTLHGWAPDAQRLQDWLVLRLRQTYRAMLETCGPAGNGVYLPGDRVEVLKQ